MSTTEVLTFIRNATPAGYTKDDFIITIYQNNILRFVILYCINNN